MASAKEYLDRYASITAAMSTWIAEQLWDGHEKDCAQYAGGPGPCNCIQTVRAMWHKLDSEIERDAPSTPDLIPQMMDLQDRLAVQAHDLRCAKEAIDYFRDQLRAMSPASGTAPEYVTRFCSHIDETEG